MLQIELSFNPSEACRKLTNPSPTVAPIPPMDLTASENTFILIQKTHNWVRCVAGGGLDVWGVGAQTGSRSGDTGIQD